VGHLQAVGDVDQDRAGEGPDAEAFSTAAAVAAVLVDAALPAAASAATASRV